MVVRLPDALLLISSVCLQRRLPVIRGKNEMIGVFFLSKTTSFSVNMVRLGNQLRTGLTANGLKRCVNHQLFRVTPISLRFAEDKH